MHIKIFIPPSREYDLELTIPLAGMQSKYCIPANGAHFRGDAHRNLHSPLAGIRTRIDSSACRSAIKILHPRERRFCNYFCVPSTFTSPQAEILYLFRFMVPASGDAHKNFHSPLAGIRSGIDNSACGDAIKILHSRERSFCNIFAEMHIEIYIPPSREYEPESTVPLVGVQSKFYIPASGDFVIISVYRPRERRCT